MRFRVDKIVKFVLVIFFYNCIPNSNRLRQGVSDYRCKICMVRNDIFTSFKLTSLENEAILCIELVVVND